MVYTNLSNFNIFALEQAVGPTDLQHLYCKAI